MSDEFEQVCAAALADHEAFARWASADMLRGARVVAAMDTLDRLRESEDPFDLAVMRDASLTLLQAAQEGGFAGAAVLFESIYEGCCQALLPYLGWL